VVDGRLVVGVVAVDPATVVPAVVAVVDPAAVEPAVVVVTETDDVLDAGVDSVVSPLGAGSVEASDAATIVVGSTVGPVKASDA